ncbi:hypothetical protein ACFYNY_34610 [Streptomyces sp. NPDC006530]|uniref:hypothetical protein n=1 Tax=Streptomyces sp. NPDC006530 TaxID=3364750 RepID=UPI00367EA1D7
MKPTAEEESEAARVLSEASVEAVGPCVPLTPTVAAFIAAMQRKSEGEDPSETGAV